MSREFVELSRAAVWLSVTVEVHMHFRGMASPRALLCRPGWSCNMTRVAFRGAGVGDKADPSHYRDMLARGLGHHGQDVTLGSRCLGLPCGHVLPGRTSSRWR